MSFFFSTFVNVWSQLLLDAEKHVILTQDGQLAELCDIMEDFVKEKDVFFFDSTKKMEGSDVNEMDFLLRVADVEALVKGAERIPEATGSLFYVLRTLNDSCFSVFPSFVGKSNATTLPFTEMGVKLSLMMTLLFWAACKIGKLEWALDNSRLSLGFLIQLAHNVVFSKQEELRSSLEESFSSSTICEPSESIIQSDTNEEEANKKKTSKEFENIFVATLISVTHVFFSWAPNALFTVSESAERARKYVLQLQRVSSTSCALSSSLPISEHLDILKEVAKELDAQWISIHHSPDVSLFPPPLTRLEKSPSPIYTDIKDLRGISPLYSVSPSPSVFIPLTPTTLSRGERTVSRCTGEDKMMTTDSKKVRISYSSKSSDKPASEERQSCTPVFFPPSGRSDEVVKSGEKEVLCSSQSQHQCAHFSIEKYVDRPSEALNSLQVAPFVSFDVSSANRVQEMMPPLSSHSSLLSLKKPINSTVAPNVTPKSSLTCDPPLLCPFSRISHLSPLKSEKNNAKTHEIQPPFRRVPLLPRNVKSASVALLCGKKNKTVALSTPRKPPRRCSFRFVEKASELSNCKCKNALVWNKITTISGFPVLKKGNLRSDAKNIPCKLSTQSSSFYFRTTPPGCTASPKVLPPLFSLKTSGEKMFSAFEKDAAKSSPVWCREEVIATTSGGVGRIRKIRHLHCTKKEANPRDL